MNPRPPRIGLYQPYPHSFGGMHAIVVQLAKALPAFGYEPIIITPEEGSFTERMRDEQLPCLVCTPGPAWRVYSRGARRLTYALSPGRLLSLTSYWRHLARALRDQGVALLHCNDYRGVLLGAPAARLAGLPSIWHMHGYVPSPLANVAASLLATWKVPVSEGMLDDLKVPRWLFGNHQVICNGLDLDTAEELPGDGLPFATGGAPVILAVGTLHPRKGFETLIKAFQAVRKKIPATQCWIAGSDFGDGAHSRHLRDLAVRLGLIDSVKFLGHSREVRRLLHRATLLAIPSRTEVFGLVAVEAMLAGKPVVACRTGGLKDIVAHGATGLLVTPQDPRAMAAALVEVLNDRTLALRLGRAGRERALTHFNLEKMTAAFAAFYGKLLKNAGPLPGPAPTLDRSSRIENGSALTLAPPPAAAAERISP